MQTISVVLGILLSTALIGCGGGGGSDASTAACRATMANPLACAPTLRLSLTDSTGLAISQVSPERAGALQVTVKDGNGAALPNVVVTFTSTDRTAVLVPASGTALTDAGGVARVGLPAGTQSGAFSVTANAVISGVTTTGATNYAVTLPTLTLGALSMTPANLSAGGTGSLGITVMNGSSPYTPAQSVSFTSPCAAAGKATISSPVTTVNGVASTSYIDKGCGGADTITASTSFGGATATQTGTLTVLTASAGQVAFVSALPQNIALKGTGGPGRQESSTVTFKVLDKSGNAVAGAPVNFFVFSNTGTTTGTGGLTLHPTVATSGADGSVSTVVSSGTVNTPIRISATIAGTSPAVTSLSDQLVISTGIPDQNSFSLSTTVYNTEGMDYDGCAGPTGSIVTVSLADHFNNPVPDGTAVSFTAEGGVIDASCLTGLNNTQLTDGSVITQKGTPGRCGVRFCAADPRPDDGRVTIMAYALGEESFTDDPAITNSINRYDPGEDFNDLCEPFRDDSATHDSEANSTVKKSNPTKAGETACPIPGLGEPYIDTNADGRYTSTGNGQYNGVLNFDPATQTTVANGTAPTVHVRRSLVQVLSGSRAAITPLFSGPVQLDQCVNGTPFANAARTIAFAIRDTNPTIFPGNTLAGNTLPAGTVIAFTASNGKILGESSYVVLSTNEISSEAWTYRLTIQSDATQSGLEGTPPYTCGNPVASGPLTVKVTTPNGTITSHIVFVTD